MDKYLKKHIEQIRNDFPNHFTDISELSKDSFEKMILVANYLLLNWNTNFTLKTNKNIGILFYQPSTRTKLSFEIAAKKLGFGVAGFSDFKTTRAGDYYEEALQDVIRVFSELCDCLVIRHFEYKAIHSSRIFSTIPIISAGDGYFQHPTQAIGDVYTMINCLRSLNKKKIGFIGSPNIRSIKTISMLLSNYDVTLYYLPPKGELFPEDLNSYLEGRNVKIKFAKNLEELLKNVDLVETIGINHPNHNLPFDKQSVKTKTDNNYKITYELLSKHKLTIPILHPGPRTDELLIDKDKYSNCLYFDQVKYGTVMRMVLYLIYLT